jgi:hypothetical protein
MKQRSPEQTRAWLRAQPPLAELREAFPQEWKTVKRDVQKVVARGDLEELKAYVLAVSETPRTASRGERRRQSEDAVLATEARRQMAAAALKQVCLSAATGVKRGRVRFNLVNGYVAQKLFFKRGLERKPVSLFWFRMLWPLIWQKRLLMPLVEPKGIYCFYSKPLIKALTDVIGERSCVEIAAGDGTLSRFLDGAGVAVTATDDYSWDHTVQYAETVLRQDAREALRVRQPQAVVCSWPPPGNTFERDVFKTPSVDLYVVISSHHEFASGNWTDYEEQADFEFAEDPDLSRLVLPRELEAAVYVFRRRASVAR